jgi:uncharacterized protein YndB with AHSA1/START domain
MSDAAALPDRIEREIQIDARIERVWRLVSEPGWWIGDGDRSNQTVTRDGELTVVDDPKHGRYPVLHVSADAPRYASFRSTEVGRRPGVDPSTLVEFFLAFTSPARSRWTPPPAGWPSSRRPGTAGCAP